jgi:hypothetical protein
MADAFPSRLGQADLTGGSYTNDNALFLKVFSGEVLTAFAQRTVMMGRHMVRTISSGKSAQFPRIGRTSANYHTPGAEITGDQIAHNEKVITIDDLLLASVFIANIDEAKNHYDVRSVYSAEMGVALANQMDKHVMQNFLIGATQSAAISGETGMAGTVIDRTDAGLTTPASDSFLGASNGANLVKGLFTAAKTLDENNVPDEGRFAIVKPREYYALANLADIVSADYARRNVGARESGRVFEIAGIEIVKSNNMPNTDLSSSGSPIEGDAEQRHSVNAASTAAIIGHPSGVGTVKLMDLSTEMEYQIARQGTLAVAKYAVGHGVLRPEACIQLKDVQGS